MPNKDKTGPIGMGPLTGRGLGPCGRSLKRAFGFGYGRDFGRGLGRFFGWNQPQTAQEQKQALIDYQKALEEELQDVQKEVKNLK